MKSVFGYVLLFALLIALGLAGSWWFQNRDKRGYPEPLPVVAFMERPLQFSGNRYHLNAAVVNILASEDRLGRIVLVESSTNGSPLPLFIPSTVEVNLGFQQRYRFNISVESGGLLFVHGMSKI
ncbi:MAG: hypothetical protein AAGJ81_00655 [Verrucomicrobiota bacterium]